MKCEYYTYDLLNRLTGVETNDVSAQYSYYVDNLRKTKTVGDSITGYAWSNGNLVAESTGAVYNYAIDGIAFSGNEFYVKNGHGDVTALTDANGTITKNYQFDAFGNQQTENQNDINPFRYSGEYLDKISFTVTKKDGIAVLLVFYS